MIDPTFVEGTKRILHYNPSIDAQPPEWVEEYLTEDTPDLIYEILMGCKKCNRGEFYEGIFNTLKMAYAESAAQNESNLKELFNSSDRKIKQAMVQATKSSIGRSKVLKKNSLEEMILETRDLEDALTDYCDCSKAINNTLMFDEPFCEKLDLVPNLVSSLCEDGLHRPCVDIDNGHPGRMSINHILEELTGQKSNNIIVVDSTNNEHLYIPDIPMDFLTYVAFLKILEAGGWVEPGYVGSSISRGYSSLRAPGIVKPDSYDTVNRGRAEYTMEILIKGLTEVGKKRYRKNGKLSRNVQTTT